MILTLGVLIVLGFYQNCAPFESIPLSISDDGGDEDNILIIPDEQSIIPLFLPPGVSQGGQSTRIRITNTSDKDGNISVTAFDNAGTPFGPFSVTITARSTIYFNSTDLGENISLSGDQLSDLGFLWIKLESHEIEIAYGVYFVNTESGSSIELIYNLHEIESIFQGSERKFVVSISIFKPNDGTSSQTSMLRLTNAQDHDVNVRILSLDDNGLRGGTVSLTLTPKQSLLLNSNQLENSDISLFRGQFGNGIGMWRLSIESDAQIHVMHLAQDSENRLSILD